MITNAMITNALTVAQELLVAGRKEVLAVGLMMLYTLGIPHPANAQEVTYIIFDPPGSTFTQPASINAEGAITGTYGDAQYVIHGFLRARDGSFITCDPPGTKGTGFGPGAGAAAINGAGVITGSYNSGTRIHGFLRSRAGTFTKFDVPGATTTVPTGINEAMEITGGYYDKRQVFHGFLRARDGTLTTFDAPGSTTTTNPIGINRAEEIAGCYDDANGVNHGFLRAPDGTITTFDPPGYSGTDPSGINSAGTIIGVVNQGHGFVRM